MARTARHTGSSTGSRLANIATNVMIVVVMAVALMLIVPALLGLQRYVITSGSMAGTYDIGSVVFSEEVPVEQLEVGDVITYVPPAEAGIDHLVTHRIVSIEDGEFRTQGDASSQVDPWVFQLDAATQPRAVASVPYVGYLFIALADRTTRMAVIGVPATLIALLALVELVRAVRRPEDEDETVTVTVAVPTPRDGSGRRDDAPRTSA